MAIRIREITGSDYAKWDAFVLQHSDGTFCHLAGWKPVIEEGAGHECPYLFAVEEGEVLGIVPLTFRRSVLFGNALISNMFGVYGGVLASTYSVRLALEEAVWDKALDLGVNTVSFKTIHSRHKTTDGWQVDSESAATFRKKLSDTPEAILLDIPRKQRAVVRKSLESGLTCSWEKDLDTFYHLYASSVKNLGTPVFPKRLFEKFLEVFDDAVEIQIISAPDGMPVASLMSFYFESHVLPYYAGGVVAARQYGAHDFMYYQLMVRAAAKGKSTFDFGRSKVGSGPYKFKKNWGFEPMALEYEYQLADGATPQDLSPSNKKFELMVKLWKKLPLGVANLIGPQIARHLG